MRNACWTQTFCGNDNDSWVFRLPLAMLPPPPQASPLSVRHCALCLLAFDSGYFPCRHTEREKREGEWEGDRALLHCWHTAIRYDNDACTMIKLIMTQATQLSRADIICELLTSIIYGHKHPHNPCTCIYHTTCCHLTPSHRQMKMHHKVYSTMC